MGAHESGPNAEQEPSVDSFATIEDRCTTSEALQFSKGNILDILQNPLHFEHQDSKPPGHNSLVEGTSNEAGPNQPSRLDELGHEQQQPDHSSCPEDANSGRWQKPVVFLDELSSSSILGNPVLRVSAEDPVTVPAGGKIDVGFGTEAEGIHSVRQNIVFL